MKHKNHTKKFKIYPWITIEWSKKEGFDWTVNLIPSIEISREYYDFEDSEMNWFTIIFSFLIFGITFDWRKEWEEKSE